MADGAEDIVSRRTRGLDRAFEILEFLRTKRQPMRPNEIAVEIGAPRSSIYELINLLLRHGMLDYQGGDGRVFLGRKLYFLGTAYADQFDLMRELRATCWRAWRRKPAKRRRCACWKATNTPSP